MSLASRFYNLFSNDPPSSANNVESLEKHINVAQYHPGHVVDSDRRTHIHRGTNSREGGEMATIPEVEEAEGRPPYIHVSIIAEGYTRGGELYSGLHADSTS
jgi:hypothetical protein